MVEVVISDVDGVLTNGHINMGNNGEIFKNFDVKDGRKIVDWIESGNEFIIVTGRSSGIVEQRADELGITTVYQGVSNKLDQVQEIASDRSIGLEKIAYIGDDITDLRTLGEIGVGCCPADAVQPVQRECDYVSNCLGGKGAVRDILEFLSVSEKTVVGIIPARYGSTRLPGKPLIDLCGKPMIQHVYERASDAETLDDLIVATDNDQIIKSVESIGGTAVHTDPEHPTGTDRVAEVARNAEYDITVNIQGDEPLIDPNAIDATVNALIQNPSAVATSVSIIEDKSALGDENVVKVVRSKDGNALYFSRSQIPSRGSTGTTYKHIGLYAFETNILLEYVDMDSTLEEQEDLEQLRLLENGYDIQTTLVEYDAPEVNVEEDVEKVESVMREEFQ